MEIKRLNKLWSNDNIYIYESLNIPVESSSNEASVNGFHAGSNKIYKTIFNCEKS